MLESILKSIFNSKFITHCALLAALGGGYPLHNQQDNDHYLNQRVQIEQYNPKTDNLRERAEPKLKTLAKRPENLGNINNGSFGCTNGHAQYCGVTNEGECSYGIQACVNREWGDCVGAISPVNEVCDGKDNDCDGQVDEDFDLLSDPQNCGLCGKYCLKGQACQNGACIQSCSPAAEVCDSLDNDCDGLTDEEACPGGMVIVSAPTPFYIDNTDNSGQTKDEAIALCGTRGPNGRVCNVEEIDFAVYYAGIIPSYNLATTEGTDCCCPCGSYSGPSQQFWIPEGGMHGFDRGKCECWFEDRPEVPLSETHYRCCSDLNEDVCSHASHECRPTNGNILWRDCEGNWGDTYERCCTGCSSGETQCSEPAQGQTPGTNPGGCCPGEPGC